MAARAAKPRPLRRSAEAAVSEGLSGEAVFLGRGAVMLQKMKLDCAFCHNYDAFLTLEIKNTRLSVLQLQKPFPK